MKRKKPPKHKNGIVGLELKALFRQPPPGFYHLPDIEIRGGSVTTDGCRKVLEFTRERLCLDMGRTVLIFYGHNLQIESLQQRRLLIAGQIVRIELAGEAGDDR